MLFHDTSVDVIRGAALANRGYLEMIGKMQKVGEKTLKFEVHGELLYHSDCLSESSLIVVPCGCMLLAWQLVGREGPGTG